jgi:cyclopropane fatty-acyl-phospholipid synthase-like methyltransferase
MNIYCKNITEINNFDSDKFEEKSDLSEGIFNNQWNITNSESMKLKYDTYYDYLKLKPGMKLLDIGCGNCQWLNYCKKKGIKCYGITISKAQADFCKSNGIKAIQGDIHKGILKTIKDKFDAISAIGPVEHFSTVSQTNENRQKILRSYYSQVKNLINFNSSSRRYLNSIMTINENYSKRHTFKYYSNYYFIIGTFGYGSYPYPKNIEKIYNSKNSKIIIKRDYTEDYRWASRRYKSSLGYCNYILNTPYRTANFFRDILIDPSWWQRLCYGHFDCWLWQFGGSSNKPIPHVKDTPIRGYVYVTEINK